MVRGARCSHVDPNPTLMRISLLCCSWKVKELSDGPARQFSDLLRLALEAAGAEPPADRGFPYWMESALWHEAGIPALVCGPAGGGLHAVDEWVDLHQVSRFAVALHRALRQSPAQ